MKGHSVLKALRKGLAKGKRGVDETFTHEALVGVWKLVAAEGGKDADSPLQHVGAEGSGVEVSFSFAPTVSGAPAKGQKHGAFECTWMVDGCPISLGNPFVHYTQYLVLSDGIVLLENFLDDEAKLENKWKEQQAHKGWAHGKIGVPLCGAMVKQTDEMLELIFVGEGLHLKFIDSTPVDGDGFFDFLTALKKGYFCDIQFQTKSGGAVAAHRAIVRARLPCLQHALDDPTTTNGSLLTVSLLKEYSHDAVQAFVQFLYSDTEPALLCRMGEPGVSSLVDELLALAQKCDVPRLVGMCKASKSVHGALIDMETRADKILDRVKTATDILRNIRIPDAESIDVAAKRILALVALAVADALLLVKQTPRIQRYGSKKQTKQLYNMMYDKILDGFAVLASFLRALDAAGAKVSWHEAGDQSSAAHHSARLLYQGWETGMELIDLVRQALDNIRNDGSSSGRVASPKKIGLARAVRMVRDNVLKSADEYKASLKRFQGRPVEAQNESLIDFIQDCLEEIKEMVGKLSKNKTTFTNNVSRKRFRISMRPAMAVVCEGVRKSPQYLPFAEPLVLRVVDLLGGPQSADGQELLGLASRIGIVSNDQARARSLSGVSEEGDHASNRREGTMMADMEKALDGWASDVCIVVDGHRIHAHRVVLAARCEYFRLALLSGMKESNALEISVPDFSIRSVTLFVRYLYSGSIDLLGQDVDLPLAMEVLSLADKFQVLPLKSTVDALIVEWLNSEATLAQEALLDSLLFADRHTAPLLKEHVMELIAQHKDALDMTALPESLRDEVERVNEQAQDDESSIDNLDNARLQDRIRQMKEVLGGDVEEDKLVHCVLAADYDLTRAINFFVEGLVH